MGDGDFDLVRIGWEGGSGPATRRVGDDADEKLAAYFRDQLAVAFERDHRPRQGFTVIALGDAAVPEGGDHLELLAFGEFAGAFHHDEAVLFDADAVSGGLID